MNWTEKDLQSLPRARLIRPSVAGVPFKMPPNEAGHFALGRLPAGAMNKTEAAYDTHLCLLHRSGGVLWHKFEAVKLRLAVNTFYTPDFLVLPDSGVIECREVKGFMMEDASVKIKVAASIYPFKFILVRKQKDGGWSHEEY